MNAAAALDNAKARLTVGWPLIVLLIAFYAPATGAARLVLIAAGLFFLGRPHTGAPAHTPKSSKPAAQRPRDTEGRWIK